MQTHFAFDKPPAEIRTRAKRRFLGPAEEEVIVLLAERVAHYWHSIESHRARTQTRRTDRRFTDALVIH